MRVELLYCDGAPSPGDVVPLVEDVLEAYGVAAEVATRAVRTERDARALGFPGSPTIRIDGRDVDPYGAGAPPSLSCRVYWTEDGHASAVPTRAQLEEAVLAAAATQAARAAAPAGRGERARVVAVSA